jgi:hypothetical protein
MPIDRLEDRGIEKDGTKSTQYCKYCYQNGEFTEPDLTFEQMKANAILQMRKQHVADQLIQQSVSALSGLKRWKTRPMA